jgi:uncharacterized protein (TIGR02588 family)
MKRTIVEKIVFSVSAALIILVAIGLVIDIFRTGDSRPLVTVQIVRTEVREGGYEVELLVRNSGRSAAEQVHVEAHSGEETGSFTVDYLPEGSSARGIVRFSRDPRLFAPKLRIASFRLP